jgi:hypothetical protein
MTMTKKDLFEMKEITDLKEIVKKSTKRNARGLIYFLGVLQGLRY